jgi:eukaryotic-like serine/threonine-protein kinase
VVWVDRDGREQPINVPPRSYRVARVSPAGTHVALWDNDIWIFDLRRGVLHRLTDSGETSGAIRSPVWSPNGSRVAFSVRDGNTASIYWQAADGSGSAERLSVDKTGQMPTSFTPDGNRLLFQQPLTVPYDIGMMALDKDRHTEMLLTTTFDESNPEVSPDGRWLAYQSNESGSDHQIYVRPFGNVNASRRQVSINGGTRPVWSGVGRELFYYVQPNTIMAVPVKLGSELGLGAPRIAVRGSYASALGHDRHYDISPDGKSVLLLKETDEQNPPQAIVVLNWFEELKRLVPIK